MKDVGDTALIMCGYFSDSVNNTIVDLSYYRGIGKTAYTRLHSYVPSFYDKKNFYKDISMGFEDVVSVISILSKRGKDNSNDLLYSSFDAFRNDFKKIG
ncbi:MAG: hypothetical protein HOE90_19400 [Bacteriovoracaceae bacterium]|nr:hypothetical protein [Bacteriovoracaceae bacterium]